MESSEKFQLMTEVKNIVVDYLQEELTINVAALKSYDNDAPIQSSDPEIKRIREIEAIKLRDRIHELTRHIAVIKRMIPNA